MKHLSFFKRFSTTFLAFLLLTFSTAVSSADSGIVVTGTADAGTYAFGNVQIGAPITANFTITNNGEHPLTLGAVTIGGADAAEFTSVDPTGPIAGGATTTFSITCTPTSTGPKNATFSIVNNAPGALNPYNFALTATGTAPDINITGFADNSSSYNFGNVTWGGTAGTKFFTIVNTGTAPLTLSAPTFTGTGNAQFTASAFSPTGPIGAGANATFTVTFTPTGRGTASPTMSIANNVTGSKNPYTIDLVGKGVAPVMTVTQGGPVLNNSTVNFGNVLVGSSEKRLFTVLNTTGDVALTLGTPTVTGTNPSAFSISAAPGTNVAIGSSLTFEVTYTPLATPATQTALLSFVTNDPARNPFTINLTGGATAPVAGTDTYGYIMKGTPIDTVSLLNSDGSLPADVVSADLLVGDDVTQSINLGFSFSYYDRAYTTCEASTNGLLLFGALPALSGASYSPSAFSSNSNPANYIAPFWTDLYRVDGVSKILYSTRGSAPNRVFILEYRDMGHYSNRAIKVTFQAKLYEGTNTIEFQYKSIDAGFAALSSTFASGIKSRNFPASSTDANYAPNLSGYYGIQNGSVGSMTTAGLLPRFPSAVTFTRPITIKIESAYKKTDLSPLTNVGSLALGLNPVFGTTYAGNVYGSVKRFEAPAVIYLDKDFAELSAAGEIDDSNPAWYRLVNDGYSIDGQQVQGANTFFTVTLTQDVTVVWRWRLECAVVIESATGQGGFGNPAPDVGRFWYKPGDQFNASIDSSINNADGGFRFTTVSYSLRDKTGAILGVQPLPFTQDTSARRTTAPISITDPLHLTWNFTGQVRYRFDAVSADAGGGMLDGQSFVRVYKADNTTVDQLVWGTGANSEVWIESGAVNGRKVEVGVFYRTIDRSLTLGNFAVPPGGDLGALGTSVAPLIDVTVTDQLLNPRTARIYTVSRAINPTDIHWVLKPTVFRAVVELGRSLDIDEDGSVPNGQLFPVMPAGAALKVNGNGPGNLITTRIAPPDNSFLNGDPLRWDAVDLALFPVRPGSYEVNWPDGIVGGNNYQVEILSGYPGDTVKRSAPAEDSNGSRIRVGTVALTGCATTKDDATVTCASTTGLSAGMTVYGPNIVTGALVESVTNATTFELTIPADATASAQTMSGWNYQTTIVLPQIDPAAGFPAQAENAHYRHLFDSVVDRQAPTKLDISDTDTWKFQDLTFADASTAATITKTAPGIPFNASGAGRSVLLYSARSNPDEIADGNLAKENLFVRVVRSKPVTVVPRGDSKLVLGGHALELGSGSAAGGAHGVIQNGLTPLPTTLNPGDQFVVDFWLNAKDLLPPRAVGLTNCTTSSGNKTVTCASTANIVVGMSVSGTNISAQTKITSITNGTTFVINNAATANGSGLSLSASNKPVTVFSTGGGGLSVTLDEGASTVTLTYRGVKVVHPLSKSGMAWRHYAIHAFNNTFFGVNVTVLDFYLDGIRQEQGFVTQWFPGNANSTVGTSVSTNSLRFGVDAEPRSGLRLDNFRLFSMGSDPKGYLTAGEVRQLRTMRDMTTPGNGLRSINPTLSFGFESAPVGGSFANQGSLGTVALGPVTGSGIYAETWANVDFQEVATRIEGTLDNAGFNGSGYILNANSNYNVDLYNRTAEIGQWGPIYPVNHNLLFNDPAKRLEVAYYENPYLVDPMPHPNVAWPYCATEYRDVVFPTVGPNKDKAIYIASRVGSEGIDQKGYPQGVFTLDKFAGLQVYNQPDVTKAGYNPNEEHALTAPSGRAALKVKNAGEALANNPPLAAFALQTSINNKVAYTSDPWVLVQVNNLITGEPEMAAYKVFEKRSGSIPFPRPADSQVGGTTGLAYEPAATPELRFLTLADDTTFDFNYDFEYPVFAGDLLIPPYPLNIVIGNASMADERGGNIQVGGVNRRTLWRDAGKHAWIVSGGGRFFEQFFYPLRADFSLPGQPIGAPVAWLPTTTATLADFVGDNKAGSPELDDSPKPMKVKYSSAWRSDYPKLKRGETLTYQGGEYFNEHPGSNGLPALVAMKAAEIVYDSATPDMVIGTASVAELNQASARIIRPLDRRQYRFTNAQMIAANLKPGDPASSKVIVVAERWYFKDLTGSLQKRFYYDSLEENLVFRGRLNDKESGNPALTAGPDPINVLEPAVMTLDDYKKTSPDVGIRDLSSDPAWQAAIDEIFKKSQNPNGVTSMTPSLSSPLFLQGVKSVPSSASITADQRALVNEQKTFWKSDLSGTVTGTEPVLLQLDSFGVGAALVPNASLLTQSPTGSLYVTIAENNRAELNGAPVSLHIIEIIPDRFRGAIKVIEGSDAFSEKITLQHNGEFGANTGDLDYEWWIRDARQLDTTLKTEIDSLATALPNPNWQRYASGPALHTIVFQGRPDVVLADKLVLMRYRHKSENKGWKSIPFELGAGITPAAAWQPGSNTLNAPFQWAGAANSPQFQADGSKRYIPQLVMGWVKRVLDRLNPYEARYTDFFSNESPATYSSQIQIAGGPYAGNVALNPDKNVIERTGLIELYRTVLARAKSLSIKNSSNGNTSDGINQALLLAATRLSVLYELLGREAYSDAQDNTISAGEDGALGGGASFTHAFQNMEADLQHEELALLRGTDFRKSYPVFNRMFWNYAKGLGEAAYNVNYNIYDVNTDGFINEDDARALYPQGHGDAWGHMLSAIDMHYLLLQEPNFSWKTRSELYSLMQNVLEVDFLDEKTFARLASGKARAGRDIVRSTYRLAYTQDPDGQWQGYTDSADKARAWGVSEWAHRAGQGAYFDWAVANALIPAESQGENPENLDRIDRLATIDEVGEIAGGMHEIQVAMDEANSGYNPLGFDSDALAFDIDQQFYDNSSGGDRRSHFEQIYICAVDAGNNALATLDYATQADNKLRALGDDTNGLIQEAMRQDLDYRNQLIEIFGRPYSGQIGFGKAFPEGYEGPDTLLFAYLDKTKIDQIVPPQVGANDPSSIINYTMLFDKAKGSEIMNNKIMVDLYNNTDQGDTDRALAFKSLLADSGTYRLGTELKNLSLPYNTASRYGFQAPTDLSWGQRTSYGAVQGALQDMLADEIELDAAISDYIGFLKAYENKLNRLHSELERYDEKEDIKDAITGVRAGFTAAAITAKIIINTLAAVQRTSKSVGKIVEASVPTDPVVGLAASIPTAPAEGAAVAVTETVAIISETARDAALAAVEVLDLIRDEVVARLERDVEQLDQIRELEGILEELENHISGDRGKRDAIGTALHNLEIHRQAYFTAQASGFRLLKEREAFNKILAAKVQKNRYQDMVFRLSRNEAMSKYQTAYNNAARYTWLAARAYDYETSLDPGHPAAPGALLDKIVKERQLGKWTDGAPQVGHGGLAEILAQFSGNFQALKGQLGINNPQSQTEKISLRSELFRISTLDPELEEAMALKDDITATSFPAAQLSLEQRVLLAKLDDPSNQEAIAQAAASDDRWKDALKARIVPDLNKMPEFVRHCRPFATGVQPGIVLRFSTCIEPGKNFFGLQLAPGDHNYSTANYATKIQSFGVWMDNYNDAGLSTSPRAYLVPVGIDKMRTSTSAFPIVRQWNVVEQRIPIPYPINQSNISSPNYIPTLNGIDGAFGELRRHGDFRMYHDNGDPEPDDSETIASNRLVSRSVWNSEWMLIIPGANLHVDPDAGLEQLTDTIKDIKLYFLTYSHQGQ